MSSKPSVGKVTKQDNIIKILLLLLFLVAVVYVYKHIEIYEETVRSGFSNEAKRQPYLGAEFLLESYDTPVTQVEDFRQLGAQDMQFSSGDIVIITEAEIALPKQISNKLLAFVAQGGHIISSVYSSAGDEGLRSNQLLNALGVSIEIQEPQQFSSKQSEMQPTVIVTSDNLEITAGLEPTLRIVSPDIAQLRYAAGTDYGNTLVEFEYEQGLVSLLADAYLWNNQQIAQYENVELLKDMAAGAEHVYIVSSRELPHWFSVLYGFSPYFIWTLLILSVLVVWYSAVRFGPIFKQDKQLFTPFKNHIDAAGQFYWRNGQQELLITQARQSLLVALYQKRPLLKAAQRQEIIHYFSLISQYNEEQVERLLYSNENLSATQFTHLIAGLQTLRKLL